MLVPGENIHQVDVDEVPCFVVVSPESGIFVFDSVDKISQFLSTLGFELLLGDLDKPITIEEFYSLHPEYRDVDLVKELRN